MSGVEGIGELLREKRRSEGLSLRNAGAASGIAWSTLGRIEKGGEPSARVYRAAMAWLNGEGPLLPLPPMTLRDWFAGQVLYGLHGIPLSADERGNVAYRCYAMADAMLAARTKGGES